MTVKKINGEDVRWGTDGLQTVATTCLSCNTALAGQKENIPNNTGGTRGMVFYEDQITVNLEVLCPPDSEIPSNGDAITVDGIVFYCTNVEKRAANRDFQKLVITAETSATMLEV